MKGAARVVLISLAAALASGGALADPQAIAAGNAIASTGSGGAAACAGCHGVDGGGQAGFPRLAGLDATYLGAQLAAFSQGTRQNGTMMGIAKALDAKATADVAAYYASLPPPAVPPSPPPPKAQLETGALLAWRGDWGANIPPCASCHGPNGHGVGAAFPAITGQSASYITSQLNAWKVGTRHDDPQGLMRTVAARLSDDQVAAVSAYYATLPAAAAPATGDARR